MKLLENNNILTDLQHSFRKHRSCETQSIKTVNDLAKSMNHGEQIDSILLGFSKAFDKVCYWKLLLKLEHYGIRGRNFQWVKKFLENRTQKVAITGVTSSVSAVTSGVPQGTVLGPLLFLIFINDLPSTVSSTIGLFADDTYIYRSIRNNDDCKILQEDVQKLMQWESCSMEFHPDKCKVLKITNKRKVIKYRYLLHNVILEEVFNAKYLGVTMNTRLSWKKHVYEICGKANQTRQFLQRNLVACKPEQNYNVIKLSYDQLWNTQARYGIQLVIINLRNKLNQYKEKLHGGLQTAGIMT